MRLVVESGADLVLNGSWAPPAWARRWRRWARGSTSRWPTRSPWCRRRAGDAAGRGDRRRRSSRWTPSTRRSFQLIAGEGRGHGRAARPDRLGRPVPRAIARRARGRDRGGGARAPDLGHGRQDHHRLGDADEQGLELIEAHHLFGDALRAHRRGRAPAVDRPLAGAPLRRRHARPPRLPGHARADLLRAALPRARRRRRCATLDLVEVGALTFEADRRRRVPVPAPGPRGGGGGRHGAVRAQRRQRGRRARVPRPGGCAFLGIPEVIERALEQLRVGPVHSLRLALRGRRATRARWRPSVVAERGAPA